MACYQQCGRDMTPSLARTSRISAAVSASAVALALLALPSAKADNTYNDTITAIFGSGNPAGGWAAEVDPTTGLTLALRAKNRTTGAINDDGSSTYTETAGTIAGGLANWNFEFSISDPNLTTDGITYQLGFDTDPTAGEAITWVNALAPAGGDAYGTSATASGHGTAFAPGDTVAQNSENIAFAGQNPKLTGEYTYYLDAYSGGVLVDSDKIQVNVVAASDASSTFALAALSFGLLLVPAALRRRNLLGGSA